MRGLSFALCFAAWFLTYFLIIFDEMKNREMVIPVFAVCSNFSWELSAFIYAAFILVPICRSTLEIVAFSIWSLTDLIIILVYFCRCKRFYSFSWCNKIFAIVFPIEFAVFMIWSVNNHFTFNYFLSFFIDFTMAAEWFLCLVKGKIRINRVGVFIGFFKTVGDVMAWVAYKDDLIWVNIFSVLVFSFNIAYIFVYLKKYRETKTIADKS